MSPHHQNAPWTRSEIILLDAQELAELEYLLWNAYNEGLEVEVRESLRPAMLSLLAIEWVAGWKARSVRTIL